MALLLVEPCKPSVDGIMLRCKLPPALPTAKRHPPPQISHKTKGLSAILTPFPAHLETSLVGAGIIRLFPLAAASLIIA